MFTLTDYVFLFRIGLCAYSGYKIYPGHGKTMVKTDGKVNNEFIIDNSVLLLIFNYVCIPVS